jgi:L-lactate dehydrogenase complex protein LldG
MTNNQTARNEVLSRVRSALQNVPAHERPEDCVITRDYLHAASESREEIIARFIEHVSEYKATVQHIDEDVLATTIATSCQHRGIRRLVVPGDMPEAWIPAGVEPLHDHEQQLTYEQLDQSDGVLTCCAAGIAQTGTIILDGGKRQGRRVLTLLPDYALCLIWEEQIVGLVPEAISKIGQSDQQRKRPLTFISGPSATSDIELNRVEGVHGPRTLEVLVIHAPPLP